VFASLPGQSGVVLSALDLQLAKLWHLWHVHPAEHIELKRLIHSSDRWDVSGQHKRILERNAWGETSSGLRYTSSRCIWLVGILLLHHVERFSIVRVLRMPASTSEETT
jgi:hypothetical protein